ncbi:MAG: DEAD/DEAH box helicase [Patescibacteria group bacterium]
MTQPTADEIGFHKLGIAPSILAILERGKLSTPTPIQRQAIPPALEGKDVIGIAQTGTGKTLAFGIPLIQRLAQHSGRGLIVLPTRELAEQGNEMLLRIGRPLGLRTVVLIGGASMSRQTAELKRNPHIIIATPGRLIDHVKQKTASLGDIKILVLDEADRMFDMGFSPQIHEILRSLPPPQERQTMLFSATMPDAILSIATKHMALPVRVEVAPAGTTVEQVMQEIIIVKRESKMDVLASLLQKHTGTVLVFTRTKYAASKIAHALQFANEKATDIHSNKSLGQRRQALEGFRQGRFRVLVATDIAARGLHIANIELVINFDLPENAEDYVHRIGRTGRAGREGIAVSLATPDQQGDIRAIERLIQKTISLTRHESVSTELLAIQKHLRPHSRVHNARRSFTRSVGHLNRPRTARGFGR